MRKRKLLSAAAGLLGTVLLLLPCPTAAKSADFRDIPRLTRASRFTPGLLPFSFNQVLSYFDDVFQKSGYRAQDHFYLIIEVGAPNELVTIAVYSTGQKIGVTLLSGGNSGVNYLREFFEAPFFLKAESEQLYGLLDAGQGVRSAALSRFQVKVDVSDTREWIIIKVEFEPLGAN
jgi:hypothetical protein